MICMCFFFKQKTAYERRISDWSSDVGSSDLVTGSLSLLRAKYVKGTFNETQIICVDGADRGLPSTACVGQNATGTLKPFDVDRSGEKIPQAPRLTWNIGATQVIPISFGQLDRKSTRLNSSH